MTFLVASEKPLDSLFHALRLIIMVLTIMEIMLQASGGVVGIVLPSKSDC